MLLPVLALSVLLISGNASVSAGSMEEPWAHNQVAVSGDEDEDEDEDEDVNDPLEPMNRFFFDVNEVLQDILLRPISTVYNEVLPAQVRKIIGNFLDNLTSPVILANDIMQGEVMRAWETLQRTVINSTIGVAGLADVAGEFGIAKHDEDFGQTLAVWGVGEGFYLVLPVFGPSNPRDAIGKLGVDPFLDPLYYYLDNTDRDALIGARIGLTAIDEYASIVDELNDVKKTSIDYYAAIRSLYRQKRKAEIANGEELDLPPIPDLTYELRDEDLEEPSLGMDEPSTRKTFLLHDVDPADNHDD